MIKYLTIPYANCKNALSATAARRPLFGGPELRKEEDEESELMACVIKVMI